MREAWTRFHNAYIGIESKHPINGLLSRTIRISGPQKGKTILNFNEAADDGVAVASAGPYTNHLHLAPDR